MLVCLDPGHGGKDPGAVGPQGTKESDIALFLAGFLSTTLRRLGYEVMTTRTGDLTVSLEERVKRANEAKANLFISLHCNGAVSPTANGAETLHYPGGEAGQKLASLIQKELVEGLGLRDRGVKARADLYVLRKTNMPAVLVEPAFITNPREEELLRDPEWLNQVAQAVAVGIEKYRKEL